MFCLVANAEADVRPHAEPVTGNRHVGSVQAADGDFRIVSELVPQRGLDIGVEAALCLHADLRAHTAAEAGAVVEGHIVPCPLRVVDAGGEYGDCDARLEEDAGHAAFRAEAEAAVDHATNLEDAGVIRATPCCKTAAVEGHRTEHSGQHAVQEPRAGLVAAVDAGHAAIVAGLVAAFEVHGRRQIAAQHTAVDGAEVTVAVRPRPASVGTGDQAPHDLVVGDIEVSRLTIQPEGVVTVHVHAAAENAHPH